MNHEVGWLFPGFNPTSITFYITLFFFPFIIYKKMVGAALIDISDLTELLKVNMYIYTVQHKHANMWRILEDNSG